MSDVKIFAFYLPQFHPIPENDAWWGNGFTEWVNVTKSKPRFRGHYQPQLPIELGFYDLRMKEIHVKQAQIAKAFGIDGFCYYHYWFNGHKLLEKPIELVLENADIEIEFMLCWANENWTKVWDGKDKNVLIEQNYESYDPKSHFEYVKQFFLDKRYFKIDGKPVYVLYRANQIVDLANMIEVWNAEAMKIGLPGVYFVSVSTASHDDHRALACGVQRIIDFQPSKNHPARQLSLKFIKFSLSEFYKSGFYIRPVKIFRGIQYAKVFNYSKVAANQIEKNVKLPYWPCVIPSWDNSARRQSDSTIIQNNDPGLFENWLKITIDRVKLLDKRDRIVFINAWNEWAEGCHLEPDDRNGFSFLEAVKNAAK